MRDKNTIEVAHICLVKIILQATEKTIPKTSPETKEIPVAWWNEECETGERIMRAEYRKYRRDPTNTTKLRSFQRRRAIKQRVSRKTKKGTWNKFVNSLNSRIPTKKVWDKFRRVNGNYKLRTIPPLKRGGNIITSPDEIADTFADRYLCKYIETPP